MLLGKSRLVEALTKAARASGADKTLCAAQRSSHTTLRFAGKRIHQNFHEEEVTVWVKVACSGRIGISTTCSLKHDSVMRAIESAMTIARVGAQKSAAAFLTTPPEKPTLPMTTYFSSTAEKPLTEIVREIRNLWTESGKIGVNLAGSFARGEDELAVVGSQGLTQYQPFSVAGLRLVATDGKASGFGSHVVREIDSLHPEIVAQRALDFCRRNKDPKPIQLGQYDVLLEPEAVAELLEWLSYIGFGAKQTMERTSFMAGRIGEKLMDPRISITDDGVNPLGLSVPFDYEGIPKQKVSLIEKGIAQNIVYDSQYASLHQRHSTGHAMPYDEFEGPIATHLFMAPGETPYREMLTKMDRGLWICRFHYISGLLKTQEALMTGLTRDGTFLVRKGKVVGAAKNLRFTQSILEAFSRIIAISQERSLVADPSQGLSSAVVPALLIKNFTFTGQTK